MTRPPSGGTIEQDFEGAAAEKGWGQKGMGAARRWCWPSNEGTDSMSIDHALKTENSTKIGKMELEKRNRNRKKIRSEYNALQPRLHGEDHACMYPRFHEGMPKLGTSESPYL